MITFTEHGFWTGRRTVAPDWVFLIYGSEHGWRYWYAKHLFRWTSDPSHESC